MLHLLYPNPLLYYAATWTSAFIDYITKRKEDKRINLQRVKEDLFIKRKEEKRIYLQRVKKRKRKREAIIYSGLPYCRSRGDGNPALLNTRIQQIYLIHPITRHH
jgi:hypothetical protein